MADHMNQLSKVVSHALRHEPWLYELELDEEGWADVESLLVALRSMRHEWRSLTIADLQRMIEESEKKRHQLIGGRIRAAYGHSIQGRLSMVASVPPNVLFHGTSPEALASIEKHGLIPMGRQYVHLSADSETAIQVGTRKAKNPVILLVHTEKALSMGVKFYQGNSKVWLADQIPWACLSRWAGQ